MNPVIEAVFAQARNRPRATAIQSQGRSLDYAGLLHALQAAARHLEARRVQRLAIALDNGPAWAIWDLAALMLGVTVVPLGGFFSATQREHAINDAGVQALVHEGGNDLEIGGETVGWREIASTNTPRLPNGTVKITYTSGTTGQPKGVCLSGEAIARVARSLADVSGATPEDQHLALLPLPVLLENIAGLYTPLLAGACTQLEPLHNIGLRGASRLNVQQLVQALEHSEATSCVMVPAMLEAMTRHLKENPTALGKLRFLAVGGGAVSPHLIRTARGRGLPVYQGYGLSECALVVSLNTPWDDDPDSVGRPLPHVRVQIAEDGEVLIETPGFLGYLGDEPQPSDPWASGDLGYLDPRGRLHIIGRKKNVFVTGFGRNVSPEWVEAELMSEPVILLAALFGEARPFNIDVIHAKASSEQVEKALEQVNARLPDYARVKHWIPADEPFDASNHLATANGRLRRDQIENTYRSAIDSQYEKEKHA